jgi:hypothetical protein
MSLTTITNIINAPITEARDAYQLAVANGFQGTLDEWLESLKADATEDIAIAKAEAIEAASLDAATKADLAREDAIAAAALDATEKAGAAKDEAIATAAASPSLNFDRPLFENYHSLNSFHRQMMEIDYTSGTAAPAYVGICIFGDSMAGPYGLSVVTALARKYGVGAYMTTNLGGPRFSSGPQWALSGGATKPAMDYSITPGSNQIIMPSGSNALVTFDPAATFVGPLQDSNGLISHRRNGRVNSLPMWRGCAKVKLFYVKAVGGGTLDVTFSQPQYVAGNVVQSTDAATGLGVIEWTPDDRFAPITINVNATLAGCTILGAAFLGERGVYAMSWNVGGSQMEEQKACLSGSAFNVVAKELFEELNCRLVINHQRASSDTNVLANYTLFFNAFKALQSGAVSLALGNEMPLGGVDVSSFNEQIRTLCRTQNVFHMDLYRMLGSLAETLVDFPGITDQTHLYGSVEPFISGRIFSELDRFVSDNSLAIRNTRLGGSGGDRMLGDMMSEALTFRISPRTGYTPTSPTATGTGYAVTADNLQGLVLTGGAAAGSVRAAIGAMASGGVSGSYPNVNLRSDTSDYSIALNIIGAPRLVAGHRAFYAFGVRSSASETSVAAVVVSRVFGIEFALGIDVGSPESNTGLVMRLWTRNTSATNYSRWVRVTTNGPTATVSDAGVCILLRWDSETKTLHLFKATPSSAPGGNLSFYPAASLTDADFGASGTNGAWAYACVHSDGVTTPAAASTFGITNLVFRQGHMPNALLGF